MSFSNLNHSLKKFYGVGMIVLSLLFIFPQKTSAQYVDVFQLSKTMGNFVVKAGSQILIQRITSQTVNWINSGFQGNPAYVTDPNQFFLDTGDRIASEFLSTNPQVNAICSPFRAQVRLALVKNYLSDNENFSCSLSTLKNDYNAFIQDFGKGGWTGWFEVTQNDQNNPYGSYLRAKDSLNLQIGTASFLCLTDGIIQLTL